jgi:flagellar assembly protein FliH
MTTSSDARVIRAAYAGAASPLATPDLRTGVWTRLGSGGSLGDAVTEDTLATLAASTRDAARAQGYAVGWAQGARDAEAAARTARVAQEAEAAHAEERRQAEHTAAVAALGRAAAELQDRLAEARRELADQATEMAFAVTSAVLGCRSADTTDAETVHRVLAALPEADVATIRLHPSVARSPELAVLPASVSVVADDSLGRADAVVELDDSVIDLRTDAALARVREALR